MRSIEGAADVLNRPGHYEILYFMWGEGGTSTQSSRRRSVVLRQVVVVHLPRTVYHTLSKASVIFSVKTGLALSLIYGVSQQQKAEICYRASLPETKLPSADRMLALEMGRESLH